MGALVELLPTLTRTQGRPPKPPATETSPSSTAETEELMHAVLAYVMRHPGCVHQDSVRQGYSDDFRRFILEQQAKHTALALEVFAAATHVPLGTLKDWLRTPPTAATAAPPAPTPPGIPAVESLHLQTVLDAWPGWNGNFGDFCKQR